MVRRTRKIKKYIQRGRGITEGIKAMANIKGNNIPYIKKCPENYVMCDQDEVNSSLCVPRGQDTLCSDPNYEFRYIPPDPNDRNGIYPKNRLTKEENGFGPIQDPNKNVKMFDIEYDGDNNLDENDPNNPKYLLSEDVMINENTGREKSYVPEFHPTSCAIQQKTTATIDKIYNNGDQYQWKPSDNPITININPVPKTFTILTQNALGLYRGKYKQASPPGSANEAVFDLMRLRTALLRNFLDERQPDFVCFQESTKTWIDLLVQQNVPQLYPYIYPTEEEMTSQETNGANATVTLMSKYPAKRATTYMLQGNSSYYNALGIYEFDNLVIINVYMQAGAEISPGQKYKWENYARCRRQQLMFIKQEIDKIRQQGNKAIVVLGDFNFELNSIRYRGENNDKADRDERGHLIYDPASSDMKWAEHKFLVGDKGLNLNDAYKELYIDKIGPNGEQVPLDVREGYTEYTDVNTFRFLGKLEEKKLRYDGVFFNDELIPKKCEVVNNMPTILDDDAETIQLFEKNGINDYAENINKYNTEYANFMVFNPKGNMSALQKKNAFLDSYMTKKGKKLSIENGFELFVSDHFGVMAELEIKSMTGGKRYKKYRYKYKTKKNRYKRGKCKYSYKKYF
jgi:exonuclease III